MIRNNKKFVRSGQDDLAKNNRSITPLQDKIVQVVRETPNCTMSDIYKEFPDLDSAGIRKAMRRMIEGHKVIQHFTVGNVPL
jgi:predicted HTH transcriptional regulator